VYMIYLKRNIKLNPKYNIYSTKKLWKQSFLF
jgi:hypothetical protein